MLEIFQEGGFPMWFLLVAALAALAAAGDFAVRPTQRRLRLTRALSLTTFWSILTGMAADVAQVGHHAPEYLAGHPGESLSTVALLGLGESMSPAIFGFSFLAIVGVLVSFGTYRAGDEMA